MIILCADDFAQNKEISEGILELAYKHRLSAISCMTKMPLWTSLAPELSILKATLKEQSKNIQLGIHFNLTHHSHDTHPLPYWLVASMMGGINRKAVEKSFNEQCDAFEDILGQIPDFIDGHQHVHAFPIIREVMIENVLKRYRSKLPYIRNINPILMGNQKSSLKSFVLAKMTQGLTPLLNQHGISYNRYFAGLYDLSPHSDFQALIHQWFEAPNQTLIMCHPGLASQDKTDPIRETRFKEFKVLNSEWFYKHHVSRLWT